MELGISAKSISEGVRKAEEMGNPIVDTCSSPTIHQ